MPFKLLRVGKRTGRYDLSRDLYVIAVQLLDGHVLQCTLSTESTGKDCMDYICQRLELQQNIFFGLRYKCARMVYRWVELDKPLRKQLEKTAQEMRLFFGVMFHTPNATSLTDGVARYYYFLQMRADVLDGRLLVSPEKAISLASYSLQIDFGDHEETKPTVATLRGTPLLPRHMTQSSQILEDLIKQVIVGYKGLRGLTRAQAELLYITEAQQCDGYGEEYFSGRDEDGSDIFIGYCMEGIIVKRLQGPPVKYKWEEIVSIMATRRNFIVNCAELAHAHFQMEDIETAKYAAYVCGLHLQFFRNFCKREDSNTSARSTASASVHPGIGYHSFPSEEDHQQGAVASSFSPFLNPVDIHQERQHQQQHIMQAPYANGYLDSVPSQQYYMGTSNAHHFASPPVALQSPFSYSTTSVDRLGPTAIRFDHHHPNLHHESVCDFPVSAAVPSIKSPLNPSMSSLSSATGIHPVPQQRVLPHRFPNRQHDGLQSWMSQQLLAASSSTLSLNRTPMSAFNGSVPHIHGIGGHYQGPQLNAGTPIPPPAASQAQMRLFNGPGRPLSLDEFNLNEMLRTAYEYQQLRQQSMSPYCQQQQPQHQQFMAASSEQSIAYVTDSTTNVNGGHPPPVFRAPPPPPVSPPSQTTNHPGMQYLASLEAYLTATGGVELLKRIPQSPPMPLAMPRMNDCNQKEVTMDIPEEKHRNRPGSFVGSIEPTDSVKATSPSRPGSSAATFSTAMMGGSDRHFVSTPDLSSVALSKSQSSPDLATKQQHLQRQQQQQQPKKSVDAKTFENLSIENLDSPEAKQRHLGKQALLRRESSGKVNMNHAASNTTKASPQRIIVGAAASSSGESDEHLNDARRMTERPSVFVSRDASQSTIATSSTSTLPDDLTISGQQAFQRFNPKLYEQQLIHMQREQQLQYRQQLRNDQEPDGVPSAGQREIAKSAAVTEHHRSVATLNLKTADENDGKERRKSVGESVMDEKLASASTGHHHRLLVNDHGGSSSEEALKSSPATPAFEDHDDQLPKNPSSNANSATTTLERNGECINTQFHPPSTRTNGAHAFGMEGVPLSPDSITDNRMRCRIEDQENEGTFVLSTATIGATRAVERDAMLRREFELIPKKRVSAGLSTAQRRENQALNRDLQVLPYEDTRVMLRPNKHNPHGYINASHVQVPIGTTVLRYIATQGPLRETVVDFWQMIWESNCRITVMLTRCMEQGKEQSFPYWPCQTTAGEQQKLKFGEYQLCLHSCTESKTHITSSFMLKHMGIGQKRLIYHLQYLDWPEGGVPGSIDSFMSFVDEVNSVKVHVANDLTKSANALYAAGNPSRATSRTNLLDNSNGSGSHSSSGSGAIGAAARKRSTSSLAPQVFTTKGSSPSLEVFGNGGQVQNLSSSYQQQSTIFGSDQNAMDSQLPPVTVHCSSGSGRTGVYLLTEVMIHALQHNQDMDMARALTMLRQKRMLLVQTFAQYRFVFTCIAQYMRKSRLI